MGFDAGVRLEESVPSEMVAVRISEPFRVVVVGSPQYLAEHGTPRTLRDLGRHDCIALRLPTSGTMYRWELERRGRVVRLDVQSRLVVDSMRFASMAAKAGLGLAYIDEPWVAADLLRGELKVVLPELAAHVSGLYLYFPQVARRTPRVRALVHAARGARMTRRT